MAVVALVIRNGQSNRSTLKFVKRDSFAPTFMAWAGVSYHGKTAIRIISKDVKVNSQFHIDNVLKSFIKNNVPKMFPGDKQKDMVFHQGSTSNHTSKQTLTYSREQNLNLNTPEKWIPKSPDAVPMSYSI